MLVLFSVLAMVATSEPTIVVTAERETGAALAACLARKCPVRDDAVASILHAQVQFADGKYPDALQTLRSSISRNRGATDEDPRAISALWYALSRVTLHNGDQDEFKKAALRSGDILAKATSITPMERQMGEVQVGDALVASGDTRGAVRRYRGVAESARNTGYVELAEMMELRAIYAKAGLYGRASIGGELIRKANDSALTSRARTMALALAAQLQGKAAGPTVTMLDDVQVQSADAPTLLLWKPTDKLTEQREAIARALAIGDRTLLQIMMPRSGEAKAYRWADIGFWIRPSGRVEDAEMLRGKAPQSWARDVVKLVQDRRYAPFQAEAGSQGHYKVERVTLTYDHLKPIGSHIRRRSGLPSYQFEELQVEAKTGGAQE